MHVQVKFADLKFTVIASPSKQASKHTHALRNEVTLVWGSLRLAPMIPPAPPAHHNDLFSTAGQLCNLIPRTFASDEPLTSSGIQVITKLLLPSFVVLTPTLLRSVTIVTGLLSKHIIESLLLQIVVDIPFQFFMLHNIPYYLFFRPHVHSYTFQK